MVWDIDPVLFGPYPLPWHAVFVVLELLVGAYLIWYALRKGPPGRDQLTWLLLVGGVHAAYALGLLSSFLREPTFNLEIRYYGVTFAIGLLLAARAIPVYFEERGLPRKHAEELSLWLPVGMILGAHLVHLAFYEWVPPNSSQMTWGVFFERYAERASQNVHRLVEIGSGLASHGGGLGAILVVIVYARRHGRNPWEYFDAGMCVAAWVIPWVRVGNFFNSEIVGRASDLPWAITFPRHDCPGYPETLTEICAEAVPRHPSQLYEAIFGFGITALAVYLQKRWRDRLRPGATFAILLGAYFISRILVEFVKDYQALEQTSFFTMGQLLSMPPLAFSVWVLFFSRTHHIRTLLPPGRDGAGDGAPPASGGETQDTVTKAGDEGAEAPKRKPRKKAPARAGAPSPSGAPRRKKRKRKS